MTNGPVPGFKERHQTRISLAVISALAIFYTVLRIFHPSATHVNPLISHDLYKYYYQMYHYAAERILAGDFPLWNPWQACGEPFMATHQCGLFYPPNIVYLLMPTHIALGVAFLIHLILSGVYTYICARRFDISSYGSLLAAITFMFAGHLAYHIGEPSNFYCAAWTPLMLYLTKRICDAPSIGNTLLIAFFSCIQFMAGFEQHYVYTVYLMLGYVIFRTITQIQKREGLVPMVRPCLYLAVAGILAVGLSAVQLLPTAEMVLLSSRPAQPLSNAQIIGLQPVLKIWTGFEVTLKNFFLSLLDPGRGMMPYAYAGLLPLMLLPVAWRNRSQRAHVTFLSCMILFCIVVALTEWGGWIWILHVPTIAMFRVLYRIMFISALCCGLLAGIGWDRIAPSISNSDTETQTSDYVRYGGWLLLIIAPILWGLIWRSRVESMRSLYVTGCFALIFLVLWLKPGKVLLAICQVCLVISLFADLASGVFKPLSFPTRTPGVYHRFDSVWDFICERQDQYRSYFQFAFLDKNHIALADKYGQLKHLRAITDYEPFISKRLEDYVLFTQNEELPEHHIFYGRPVPFFPDRARTALLNLMGTKYFVVHRPYASGKYALGQQEWWSSPPAAFTLVYEESDIRVFENPSALPRAYVVHGSRTIEDETQLLHALESSSFNPVAEVLLSEKPIVGEPSSPHTLKTAIEVTFLRDEPDHIEVSVRSEQPGFLVLSDSDYPGWHATVNGKPRPIYRANHLFRAVVLNAGKNTVTFRYRPASFLWGGMLTLASLAVLAIMVAGIVVRSPKKKGESSE